VHHIAIAKKMKKEELLKFHNLEINKQYFIELDQKLIELDKTNLLCPKKSDIFN
jgi:hypothetical protein